MMKLSRKNAVFISLAAFLLTAANVVLYIHLAQHSHDEGGHDENNCSICQQATINKPQAIVLNEAVDFKLPPVVYTNLCESEIFIQNSDFRIPYLRAPPATA